MTNKTILITVFAIISLTFMNSCKKNKGLMNEEQKEAAEMKKEISTKNEILIFSSSNQFDKFVSSTNRLTMQERTEWEKEHNFVSMTSIYHKINQAEIEREEKLYGKYDHSMTKEDFRKLGLPVDDHTNIYKEYINKGMIKELHEDDGSESFILTIIDPVIADFTNEDGLIVINDTIYQYSETCIKMITDGDFDKIDLLKSATNSNKEKNIKVFDTSQKSISDQHNWEKFSGWKYNGSRKRFRMDVRGWSWVVDGQEHYMYSKFWIEAKGQAKPWWTWRFTNSYNPICRIKGNWDYSYDLSYNWYGGGTTYNSISCSYRKSPMNYYFGHTNYYKAYLCPNGSWSSNLYFTSCINVWHYHFDGDFWGGPHGYHIYLDKN